MEEVEKYCKERNNHVDASNFVNFYASKGWMVGSSPMRDWRACVRRWECIDNKTYRYEPHSESKAIISNIERRPYTKEQLDALFTPLDEEEDEEVA